MVEMVDKFTPTLVSMNVGHGYGGPRHHPPPIYPYPSHHPYYPPGFHQSVPTPQQNPQPQSQTPAHQWQPSRNPIAGHTQTITPSLHPATAAIPQLPSIPSYWLPSTKPSLQLHPTIPTTTIHIPNHNTIPKLPLTIQAILTSHQHKKPSPP